ncbi:MAG: hypothetical protein WBA17_14440 [Saprospiraceae bacterium]
MIRQFNLGGPSPNRNPLSFIWGLAVAVIFFVLFFFLLKIVFKILWWAAVPMFIASLFIDSSAFTGLFNTVKSAFRRSPLYGAVFTILLVVLFPLTSLYLLGTALFRKKVKQVRHDFERQQPNYEGDLIDFEEIDSEPLDLDRIDQPRRKQRPDSSYDKLFE